MVPYKETTNGNITERTFSEDVNIEELVWHRDREDRTLTVIEETDWKLQFDNDLPQSLIPSFLYFIPKGIYHRVVKGSGDLKVKIVKHS